MAPWLRQLRVLKLRSDAHMPADHPGLHRAWLCEDVTQLTNLTRLELIFEVREIGAWEDSCRPLLRAIQALSQLRELSLAGIDLRRGAGGRPLYRVASRLPALTHLEIGDCVLSREGLLKLQLGSIRHLQLSCSLSELQVEKFALQLAASGSACLEMVDAGWNADNMVLGGMEAVAVKGEFHRLMRRLVLARQASG
jgi:hypothetical protein